MTEIWPCQAWKKKFKNFLGGTHDFLWPPILMHNPFLHKKRGCLQKTRALYLEKWPSYGHVKFGKRNLKISEKLARPTKIEITPSIFSYNHRWPRLKVFLKNLLGFFIFINYKLEGSVIAINPFKSYCKAKSKHWPVYEHNEESLPSLFFFLFLIFSNIQK